MTSFNTVFDIHNQIIIIPEKPGYLSISLSRSIQSITSKSLINPPSIEFNYLLPNDIYENIIGMSYFKSREYVLKRIIGADECKK